MTDIKSEVKKIEQDLIDFLRGKGHSQERAEQIAGNHPAAVRADLEAAKSAKNAKPKADEKA